MGVPRQRKSAAGERLLEGLIRKRVIVLRRRGCPRDHAARKHHLIVAAHQPRARDERVLPGAARSDHQHEPPRSDVRPAPQAAGKVAAKLRQPVHATCRPARHTPRTAGMSLTGAQRESGSAQLAAPDPDGRPRRLSAASVVTVRSAAIHRHVVARVEHSGAHDLGGRHIARMRAAAHQIGAPISTLTPASVQPLGGLDRTEEAQRCAPTSTGSSARSGRPDRRARPLSRGRRPACAPAAAAR